MRTLTSLFIFVGLSCLLTGCGDNPSLSGAEAQKAQEAAQQKADTDEKAFQKQQQKK